MSAEEIAAVEKLKVVELKARLSQVGLSTSGLKADLAARLKQHLYDQASAAAAAAEAAEESNHTTDSDATEESSSQDAQEGSSPEQLPVDNAGQGEPGVTVEEDAEAADSTAPSLGDQGEPEEAPVSLPEGEDFSQASSGPGVCEAEPAATQDEGSQQAGDSASHEQMDSSQGAMDVDEQDQGAGDSSKDNTGSNSGPMVAEASTDAFEAGGMSDPSGVEGTAVEMNEEKSQDAESRSPAPRQDENTVDSSSSAKDPPSPPSPEPPAMDESSQESLDTADMSTMAVSGTPAASRRLEEVDAVAQDDSRGPDVENDTVQTPPRQRQDEDSEKSSGVDEGSGRGESSQESASQSRDTMDEVVRKNLALLQSVEDKARRTRERKDFDVQKVIEQKGIELPAKKANETKNQKKKRRKKTRRIIKTIQKEVGASDGDSGRESERTDVEIDYVPDQVEKDLSWFQFSKVFEKFKFEEPAAAEETPDVVVDAAAQRLAERKKPASLTDDEDEDAERKGDDTPKLSKKKLKQLTRMSVAELKIKVNHPELVEMHDVTSKDPVFLLTLKATRNSVPVPRHWCFKRKYLQGKRGIEKPPFDLPAFIKRTGICEMRAALQEKEEAKTLKSKQREKVRPKMGKIDIDYQKLHDAFFKWQEKPRLSMHGDLYYEGKEFETRLKEKKPGELSDELRTALGMPTGPNAQKCPPPWLIAMQRYGPPPSYPNLKIPGLNAAIPEGCSFGYHAGGWGKPPVDETGKPLYGDVFGVTDQHGANSQIDQEVDKYYLFGSLDEEASSEEEASESEEDSDAAEEPDESGLVTPAEGLATPSGLQSSLSHAGLETPDAIELRKRKIEADMEMGDQVPQLYTVLGERKNERLGHGMMASAHTYEIPGTAGVGGPGKKNPVELALDPSELEMDPGAMAARYEQTMREQQNQLATEDFSDMVAEHAAKQKSKRKAREEAGAAGGKKKYKEFKF